MAYQPRIQGAKVSPRWPAGVQSSRPLSMNERHRRKLYELSELLRGSLRHIGLPEEIVSACMIETTLTPLVPKSKRAENIAHQEKKPCSHTSVCHFPPKSEATAYW
jgi:hypothetical protein